MSSPGWYPDPSGQPNRFRFWDGRAWSEETTDNPYVAPPPPSARPPIPRPPRPPMPPGQDPTGSAQPPRPPMPQQAPDRPPAQPPAKRPAQSPGPQQWSPTPEEWRPGGSWTPMPQGGAPASGGTPASGGASGGGRKGLWVALGAVLLVLLLVGGIAIAVYAFNRDDGDGRADEPTASETTDEPTGTDEPTETSTEPLESCPVGNPLARETYERDGRVHGGGLSFRAPRGYTTGSNVTQFEWLYDVDGVEKVIERTGESGWISMMVVGEVRRADGYTSAEQAALSLVSCMAGSPSMYASYESDEQLSSKETTVQGKDAWEVRQEIRIDDPVLEALGDTAVVIVVDTGSEETLSVFAGVVPIGNEALLAGLDRTAAGLTVD